MTEPVNLNRFAKARARAKAREQADANAVKFGRTKGERMLDAAQNKKAAAMLDNLKIEDEG